MRSLERKPERLEGFMADFVRLKTEVVFLPTSLLVLPAHKAAPHLPIVGRSTPAIWSAPALRRAMAAPAG